MNVPTSFPALETQAKSGEKGLLKRILLCRTDRLGDVILALPCVLLLKRLFPECRVTFLVQPYTAPVVSMLKGVDDLIELEARESVSTLTRTLRERDFQAAVMLLPHRSLAQALKNAAIPIRAGIAYRWYAYLFNYRHPEHRKLNLKHEVDYNLSLTYATFATEGQWEEYLPADRIFPLPLEIAHPALSKAADLVRALPSGRVVVLHPGGSGSAHRWAPGHYSEIARQLKDNKVAVIITGKGTERSLCRRVAEAAGEYAANLCDQVTLTELTALYKSVALVVTNSTGPLHLARALGTPVLGLYPSDKAMSPARWGPYGWSNNVLTPPAGKGMEYLPVETVLELMFKLLGEAL